MLIGFGVDSAYEVLIEILLMRTTHSLLTIRTKRDHSESNYGVALLEKDDETKKGKKKEIMCFQ